MKELTPKSNYSFSLCLYLSNYSAKALYLSYNSLLFSLTLRMESDSSLIFSVSYVFLSQRTSISSSSYCLSLKFYYSSRQSSLIRFYFRFTISSSCSIIISVPQESLESIFYAFFFCSSSRRRSFQSERTLCKSILNLSMSTTISPYADLPKLIVQSSSLISSNLVSDLILFSPDFELSEPLRDVFLGTGVVNLSSAKTISSQMSNLSREECLIFYISLLPMISSTLCLDIDRCYSNSPALELLIECHISSIFSFIYQFYIIFIYTSTQ